MAFALFLLEVKSNNSFANQRVFRDRLNPIDSYNDIEFVSRYRITRYMFIQLHEKITGYFLRPRIHSSHPIPSTTQFAVALQFLETGSFQTVIATSHGVSQPSVSRCIAAVTDGLCSIAKDNIKFPNLHEQSQLQQSFLEKCGFPLVVGCIDYSHVSIVAHSNNEEIYVNRKNEHSINIQAICDSDLKFMDVVAKWPGSTHDAFIWRQSGINQRFTSGDIPTVQGCFLGDSGYPLRPNLLAPIQNPNTSGERRYNRSFLKSRKTIEGAFGLWKSRWRSMHRTGGTLCYVPDRLCRLVIATMVFHNICIEHGLQWESEFDVDGEEEDEETIPHDSTTIGTAVRQSVIEQYFN